MGMFSSIEIVEKDIGPYTLVYVDHVGPYSDTMKDFEKIDKTLRKDFGIEAEKGFGIYYDNPQEVAEEKLRCEIGSILDDKYSSKIESLKGKLKVKIYSKKKSITAEFPIKNGLSYMLGPMKVYSKFKEYMEPKGYKGAPALEVYDMPNKKIIYSFPIVK